MSEATSGIAVPACRCAHAGHRPSPFFPFRSIRATNAPMPPSFLPTARQLNWLLIVGFVSLGYALYLRYLVIEQSTVSLACEGGLDTWLCFTRKIVIPLYRHSVIGIAAL